MASPPRQHNPKGETAGSLGYEPSSRASVTAQGPAIRAVDLAGLDGLAGDMLGLFCWSDVRPLKGVLGLVDWRLCGAISRAIEQGVFNGAVGDTLLLPLTSRIGPKRLIVFGLGPRASWDNTVLREGCRRAQDVTRLAGAEGLTLAAPACLGDVQIEHAFVKAATEVLGRAREPLLIERLHPHLSATAPHGM